MKTFLIRFYDADGGLIEAIQAFQAVNSERYPSVNDAIKFLLKKALSGSRNGKDRKIVDLTAEQQRGLLQKIKDGCQA